MSRIDVTYAHLSPSQLSAMVSSSLPSPKQLSSIDANSATDTFCSTLMSCLDTFCPLSYYLGYLTFSTNIVLSSGLQKGYGANPTDLNLYRSLLSDLHLHLHLTSLVMSPLLKGHTITTKFKNSPNSRMLFKTFSSLLSPPPLPPSSTLTAEDFGNPFQSSYYLSA